MMINRPDIPAPLLAAFSTRVTLPLRETARLLSMNESTLREHALAGNIRFVQIGLGTKSIRRAFRLSDVLEFLERMSRVECPSVGVKSRNVARAAASRPQGFTAMYARLKAEKRQKQELARQARQR
jgi:predicted site-specific integrase-resolvase